MRSRPANSGDVDFLNRCASAAGYPYPSLDDPLIEAVEIVVDSDGKPIMAVAAKRLVEIYMYVDENRSPAVSNSAIRELHRSMAERLTAKGYRSAEAFIPPPLCEKFGRRLQRKFGWLRNWPSFCKHF